MRTKKIVVTAEDIRRGRRHSYCSCPVAKAARRAFRMKPGRRLVVRHEAIFVGAPDDDEMWVGKTPAGVDDFITKFDNGEPVEPFKFLMEFF
jgi:hypothetical protein